MYTTQHTQHTTNTNTPHIHISYKHNAHASQAHTAGTTRAANTYDTHTCEGKIRRLRSGLGAADMTRLHRNCFS